MRDRSTTDVWIMIAWFLSILSGGLMTSLLRAPLVLSRVMPIVVTSHIVGGAIIGFLAIGQLGRKRAPGRSWRVMTVAAALATGWLTHRSIAPLTAASHAALAAFATVALAGLGPRTSSGTLPAARPWIVVFARIGFGLVFLQVAAGAALRQHVTGLPLHLFVGGLTTLAVLSVAVTTVHGRHTTATEKHAAVLAIGAVLVQVSLGVTVLFMMLLGPPSDSVWIGATVGHVAVGSLTLLAVGRLARELSRQALATDEPRADTIG